MSKPKTTAQWEADITRKDSTIKMYAHKVEQLQAEVSALKQQLNKKPATKDTLPVGYVV